MTSPAKPRRGRWRRVVVRVLVVVALLALVLPVLALLGLRTPAVREAILARVASAVERGTGVRLTARDFRLDLSGGVIEIEELVLAASQPSQAPPFFSAPRARAVVRWRTLFGDRPIVESLSIESPRLDLRAPIPAFGDETEASDSAGLALEILELDLANGEILGAPAGEVLDVWLDTWRAEGVGLRGDYRSGRFEIEQASARLIADSRRRATVELAIDGSISGDIDAGAFTVDSLRVRGDGVNLETHGEFEIATPTMNAVFDLDIEPALLFPDLTSSGRARGNGVVQLSRSPELVLGGLLKIDATDIPAELLSPLLDGVDVRGPLDPSGTRIDLDVDLDLAVALERGDGSDPIDRLSGNAELTWRREAEPLLTASVRSLTPSDGTITDREGVHVSFAGELTPRAPGRRRFSGELLAPAWIDVLAGTLRSTRFELDEPDLVQAVQRFGFDPSALPAWWPQGGVTASLEADGPLNAPRLRLDARWDHDSEVLATISARTLDGGAPPLRLSCDVSLLPEAQGRLELSGELLAPGWERILEGELREGRLVVELIDLDKAEEQLTRRLPRLFPEGLVPDGIPVDPLRGRLSARVEASGPISAPQLEVDADWAPAADESVRLVARGQPSTRFPFIEAGGEAELSVRNLSLAGLDIAGRIDGALSLDASAEGISASLRLDGDELGYGDVLSVDRLRIEAVTDGDAVDLRDLSGRLLVETPKTSFGGEFSGSGRFDLSWPPSQGEMRLAIDHPFDEIDGIETVLRLEDGTLWLEQMKLLSAGNVASLQATVPLGALAGIVDGIETLAVAPAAGPISVAISDVDLSIVAGRFDPDGALPPVEGILDGSVTFDPEDPLASVGWFTISGVGVDVQGETFEAGGTVRIEIADGRIVLPRTRLEPTGGVIRGSVPLEVSAVVDLSPDWTAGDDLAAVVDDFSLDLDGTVDAALLNPFLAGGAAEGEVALTVHARGSMDDVRAEIRIRGPDASVFYRRPYPTRLEGLEVEITTEGREVRLESARARLNGGDAEMTGNFTPDGGLDANLRFEDVHYRLDLGIATQLSGDLQIEWPVEGRRRLAGRVVVGRAVLRRPVKLNREALQVLFDIGPEAGGNQQLETIDLDLELVTDEGVLVKNNVANVRADWGLLHMTGTAADPRLDGRVDVQPGGIVTAFGIVYRIDEASLEWSGDPAGEPRWVFEWTSSLDDPTIIQGWRNELFTPADLGPGRGGILDFRGQAWAGAGDPGGGPRIVTGMAEQATSAGRTQLSYEPLPLFGETDTQARYTLSQDLSPQLAFIASTNPREAEAQTYILSMHQLPGFPSFRAQLFTNDQGNAGLTVQQTLKLGARPESDTRETLLKSKTIVAPDGLRKRPLKKSIGFRKSDPFPRGAALDVEVDVSDALQAKGYPSADVEVDVEPTGRNRVNVLVAVDPGTRVSFSFEGDRIPSGARRTIRSAYRPVELGEQAALEEVQKETSQALLARGYLDPRIDVESAPADPANPEGPRLIRVIADGGRRIGLSQLAVEGLPDEDVRRVQEIFDSTLQRMGLALESPTAEATLLRVLRRRGYPEARIADRSLSDDGETLVVRIEPGERQRVVSIEIQGLVEEDRARLTELLEIREGDPARQELIGQDARAIERDLRDRGHADARVRTHIATVDPEHPVEVALLYEVDPGPSYRIDEIRFEGLLRSRQSWVRGVAGLEPGEVFRRGDVADARGRLYRTGVFRRIRVSSEEEQQTTAGTESTNADTVVKFEFEESRRWRLAYGGRWEESRGPSAVVDVLNQHSLGRGHLTGVRGIFGSKDRSVRLYHVIPRIVGERSSLELFIEGKREDVTSTIKLRSTEAWAQLTFPLTRRIHNRPYIRFQKPELTQEGDPDAPLDQRVISPLLGWQLAFDAERRQAGELRRKGMFIGVDFIGSHESLGSDVTTIGVISQLKYFLPVGRSETGRFSWAQFWRGGWTEARDGPVPLVDRFRAGGEFSVRGYPTNSLGPLGPENLPLGGELLFVVNQELYADLFRTENFGAIAALVFFDAGNVWFDRGSAEAELFKSVGAGVRYLSPFGPLRLDLAVPLDRRPTDPHSTVYIGFGSVF